MNWKAKIIIALTVPVLVLLSPLTAYADFAPLGGAEKIVFPAISAAIVSIISMCLAIVILKIIRFINKRKHSKQ